MSKKNIEEFLSNPFFVVLKSKLNEEDVKRLLNKELNYYTNQFNEHIYRGLWNAYLDRHKEIQNIREFQEDYEAITKEALIDYLAEEDVFEYFIEEEETIKLMNLIKRKQYNAKLVNQTLSKINYFINRITNDASLKDTDLPLLLDRDIKRRVNEFNDNYVLQKMTTLKTVVDKVASGVKAECYLEFSKGYYEYRKEYSKELTDYIFQKHGYNYSGNHGWEESFSFLFGRTSDDMVLSLAVVDDENFWVFNSISKKTILSFAFLVAKYNDLSHAKKIIDYAFEQACKNPICKYLYTNKLSLYISLKPHEKMINYCVHRLENRLSSVTTKKIDEGDYNGFLFPLYEGFDKQVLKGKEIFTNFIKKAYLKNANEIFRIFQNPETIIQEETKENNRIQKRRLSLDTMLEAYYLGYDESNDVKKFMYGYYENFGNVDSILGRMYFRCYIIDKLTGNISNECLYEVFFDIFQMIENKFGIQCSYRINHDLRNKNYLLLKEILRKYGLTLDDSYKKEYITALLDRKYASYEEVELFPQLEQFGDAIYELAVDNIIFYNPNTTLTHQRREDFVKAEAQIKVSQKLNLNKLYISNLHDSLNSKYLDYEKIEMGLSNELQGNYIADSLEMIIGVIAKEFGVQKALDFTTKIILETNPDLEPPKFLEFNIVSLYTTLNKKEFSESFETADYLNKIYPGPFCDGYNDYEKEYDILQQALHKILSICIMGNDTKEKRTMIAHNSEILSIGPRREFQYVASYLYYGIEETIKRYRFIMESNSKETK